VGHRKRVAGPARGDPFQCTEGETENRKGLPTVRVRNQVFPLSELRKRKYRLARRSQKGKQTPLKSLWALQLVSFLVNHTAEHEKQKEKKRVKKKSRREKKGGGVVYTNQALQLGGTSRRDVHGKGTQIFALCNKSACN